MPAPIWLLDIDGVLNGFGRCGWSAAPRTTRAFAQGTAWRMRYAPQLIERINAIHAAGLTEIRWATTWISHGTDQIERVMGLPRFAHAYSLPEGSVNHTAAKLQAALDVIGEGRRLIWTDDDAIPDGGFAREALDDAGALLISPDDRRALRPEHLDAIEAFASAVQPLA